MADMTMSSAEVIWAMLILLTVLIIGKPITIVQPQPQKINYQPTNPSQFNLQSWKINNQQPNLSKCTHNHGKPTISNPIFLNVRTIMGNQQSANQSLSLYVYNHGKQISFNQSENCSTIQSNVLFPFPIYLLTVFFRSTKVLSLSN